MADSNTSPVPFRDLGLEPGVVAALDQIGYEAPSPIQAAAIPVLLQGKDIVGQAQTGTGKTAAFALPLLSRLDLDLARPQMLVLAPTRELAIQVSEAMQRYASKLPGFRILPIYGGQDYGTQIRALKRGVHVIVGTPGRVMDHIRKKTLKLDNVSKLVLDEADEMLRMGFIDDVEWILEQLPDQHQTALFSATMPKQIRKIAHQYLHDPEEIKIEVKTETAENIRQRYWLVSGVHKLDALTRILEAETFDATIIFVRTRTATTELAEKLAARGYRTAALNGDISQKERERTVDRLKKQHIDILIATDVAARGLDVPRISHVINYDIPHDTEAYIHRIGRTGRAGREGDAILFVAGRERRMLRMIEKATKQPIEAMGLPSVSDINSKRIERFKQQITDTLAEADLDLYFQVLEQYRTENDLPALEIAAALAHMAQGNAPLLLKAKPEKTPRQAARQPQEEKTSRKPDRKPRRQKQHDPEMENSERFRLEVGSADGVEARHLIGAICNEAGLDSQYVHNLEIHEHHSTVRLPEGMPRDIFRDLKKAWVCGKQLQIKRIDEDGKPVRKASAENKRPGKQADKKRKKRAGPRK